MQTYVVGKPKLYNESQFKGFVDEILESNMWSNNGKFVELVEKFYPSPPCAVVSNGTIALELAIQSLNLPAGSCIACPTYTFIATASAIERAGHTPLFIDVKNDYTIDLNHLDRLRTSFVISAVIGVHLFGNLCDIDSLSGYENVIYDAAHCNGMSFEGKHLGQFGEAAIFSAHPTKASGGMELGLVYSRNPETTKRVKTMRNFGIDLTTSYDCEVIDFGTNAKANEISAASFYSQLLNINSIKEHYKRVHELYRQYLPSNFELIEPNNQDSNHSYITVRTLENTNKVIDFMKKRNIYLRKYFTPLHLTQHFTNRVPSTLRASQAKILYDKTLFFPTGLHIEESDVQFICSELKKYR